MLRLLLGHLDLFLLLTRLALFSLHLILILLPACDLLFLAGALPLLLPDLILLPTGLALYLPVGFAGLDTRRILMSVLAAPIDFSSSVVCRLILFPATFVT